MRKQLQRHSFVIVISPVTTNGDTLNALTTPARLFAFDLAAAKEGPDSVIRG
jgi:hypothetical protein